MNRRDPLGVGDQPRQAVYVPLVADPALRSDTPIIADMLLEKGSLWREAAGFMLPRLSIRFAGSGERPAMNDLLPPVTSVRIIDPVTPPWIKMRDDFQAGRLQLDAPAGPVLAMGSHTGGLALPGLAQGAAGE